MAVPEQTPILTYVANGNTTEFAYTFDVHSIEDLVVTLNNEVVATGSYTISDSKVIFPTPPNDGSIVTLYRQSVLNRTTNFKSYDNSFRPETINWDLDKLWHVLQEQNLVDAKILARLKGEIEWRRTHDFNYDELAQVREKQIFDALKGYSETLFSSANPGVFAGVTAGIVFAIDGKSIQTHLEEILDKLTLNRNYFDEQLSLKAPQETTFNKIEVEAMVDSETTRAKAAEQVLQGQMNAVGVGNKAYKTFADMDADKATIPAKSKVTVTNDATASNNGDWQWDGATFTKSIFDPVSQSKTYTDESIEDFSLETSKYIDLKTEGGDLYYAQTASYIFDGYITATGSFVASSAGYKTTGFIAINSDQKLKYSLNSSSSVAAISYWDENKVFISAVTSNNNPVEVEVTPPSNARYIRSSSNLSVTTNSYVYTVFQALLEDPELIKTPDLTVVPSSNLAKTDLIVNDFYVNNSGGITAGVGWKYIKIPIVAGNSYTFGNFVIDSAGYYTFQTAAGAAIAGSNGSYQTGTLPKTLTAPVNAEYLLFDIARPTNLPEHYAQLMCNVGASLEDYVEPADTITAIKGKKIVGSGGGPLPESVVTQGGNATLADIIADSVTTAALIANLPTSATGLEIGQAYIDSGFIKVVI